MSTYIRIATSGQKEEVLATEISAGVANAGDLIRLDATGRLDISLLPVGVGPDTTVVNATEALNAGDLVNIFDDGGSPGARLADRSNSRKAHGFVLAAVAIANPATVFLDTTNTALAALSIGADYFLGVSGAIELTPTTTQGEILQQVGFAIAATELSFEPGETITRSAQP